jgi:hypothetical protein
MILNILIFTFLKSSVFRDLIQYGLAKVGRISEEYTASVITIEEYVKKTGSQKCSTEW